MIKVRKNQERGHANHGWLDSYHTFSFSDYQDPEHMGFRTLRVINEDRVQPGEGFGTHSHRDMEILTYVLEGALEHKDSMGNTSIIKPGELQRMSAGSGVTHSEFNHSKKAVVHLLQVWVLTEKKGIEPGYEQKEFEDSQKVSKLRLIASRDGRENSLTIHQDVSIYDSTLDAGKELSHSIDQGRHVWVQVIKGKLEVNGQSLETSDGIAISETDKIEMIATEKTTFLLFDLN